MSQMISMNLSDAPEDIKAQILDNDQKLREQDKRYKETTVTWLNPKCQVVSNSDIPIVGDIAIALRMIPELVRRARVDNRVYEISVWMRERQKSPYRIGNGLKRKYLQRYYNIAERKSQDGK